MKLSIKGLTQKFDELYTRHRNKWRYVPSHENHATTYDVYHKGYYDAQNEVGEILLALAEDLAESTYKLGIGSSKEEVNKGWNEGQAAAAKQIRKLILTTRERKR